MLGSIFPCAVHLPGMAEKEVAEEMIESAEAWIYVDGWAVISFLVGMIMGWSAYWVYSHYYHLLCGDSR